MVCVLPQEHLIENEVAVLRKVKHPNIVMLVEEMVTPSELCLVMELVKVSFSVCFFSAFFCTMTLKLCMYIWTGWGSF